MKIEKQNGMIPTLRLLGFGEANINNGFEYLSFLSDDKRKRMIYVEGKWRNVTNRLLRKLGITELPKQ